MTAASGSGPSATRTLPHAAAGRSHSGGMTSRAAGEPTQPIPLVPALDAPQPALPAVSRTMTRRTRILREVEREQFSQLERDLERLLGRR